MAVILKSKATRMRSPATVLDGNEIESVFVDTPEVAALTWTGEIGFAAFLTVMLTAALVEVFPVGSLARAMIVCVAFVRDVVLRE